MLLEISLGLWVLSSQRVGVLWVATSLPQASGALEQLKLPNTNPRVTESEREELCRVPTTPFLLSLSFKERKKKKR